MLPGVQRPPCLVSFSGGMDSSLVLAAATRVARREGLPDPIPATLRAPDAPDSHEAEWQEQVVTELGLSDWQRHEVSDELDLVGPVASKALRRHGVLWPANTHFHVPLLEAARGGTLLTGVGGDHLFAWGRRSVADLLARRRPPHLRDPLRIAYDLSPWRLRALVDARRLPHVPSWLWPAARREVVGILARQRAREPRRWPAFLAEMAGSRRLRLGSASMDLLAGDAGASVAHPILNPSFVAALAHAGGRLGPGSVRSRSHISWATSCRCLSARDGPRLRSTASSCAPPAARSRTPGTGPGCRRKSMPRRSPRCGAQRVCRRPRRCCFSAPGWRAMRASRARDRASRRVLPSRGASPARRPAGRRGRAGRRGCSSVAGCW